MSRSGQNFAQAMAAELPWLVQNCNLMRLWKSKFQQEIFSEDFSYELMKCLLDGSLQLGMLNVITWRPQQTWHLKAEGTFIHIFLIHYFDWNFNKFYFFCGFRAVKPLGTSRSLLGFNRNFIIFMQILTKSRQFLLNACTFWDAALGLNELTQMYPKQATHTSIQAVYQDTCGCHGNIQSYYGIYFSTLVWWHKATLQVQGLYL